MTEIDFHFNMPDKLDYACRLLRKAVGGKGACLVVRGDAESLEVIDSALWSLWPTEFVAHCKADADPQVLARSPVVLCEIEAAGGSAAPLPHQQVLVNLGSSLPEGFERFERLIELVGSEENDRSEGRRRWRHYADRGYAIKRHDFASSR
ncbi:DNA polymerase III, chi subunit [Burkholderiales bacterium 8X]|nr:DNA polymerase III, chi subunit [Burkholderiales bacterium 8X]